MSPTSSDHPSNEGEASAPGSSTSPAQVSGTTSRRIEDPRGTTDGTAPAPRSGTRGIPSDRARRPVPYARTASAAADVPGSGPGGAAVSGAGDGDRPPAARRRRRWWTAPPSIRRRPALHLTAALVGALGLGALTTVGPAAQAETATPVSRSLSVAEQLGIEGGSAEVIPDAVATERLGGLAASRTHRETEEAVAAEAQAQADRLAAEAAAEAARPKIAAPVDGGRLTSRFGARWGRLHAGIDIAAPMRTPERAVMDGVVLEAGPASGYGLVVYIQHGNGDVTVYGHMEEILVAPGQVVKAGDTIALLGNRGQSTGPHLHLEVRIGGPDGQQVDPVAYLNERGLGL